MKFELTFGIVPGYGHGNKEAPGRKEIVGKCREVMNIVLAETGVLITMNIVPTVAVYSMEHGCPEMGEHTMTANGVWNQEFCKDEAVWQAAVKRFATLIGAAFRQTTIYLLFVESFFHYIKPEKV